MRSSVDRAQAVQVGAILLFGILIVSLSLYQATVVPGQNEQIEFDGYLDANSDMDRLDSEIGAAAARDYTTRTVVRTGISYPPRTLFVNPPRPDNRVRTGESGAVVISNATAVNGEEDNTGQYWDGSSKTYSTKPVLFDSDYNELQAPSIVNENGVMYRIANENADPPYGPDDVIVMSDGNTVDGDRITLVTVAGDVDAGGNSPTIVASPKSAHTRSVVVEGDGSENITLTVPSQLSNETWEEEIVSDDVDVVQNGSNVDLVLDGDETYELRLAKVELRQQSDASDRSLRPDAHYIVPASGDNQSIRSDQSARLTAEVRDEYNNPKRGEAVQFSVESGSGDLSSETITTNSDGQATVQFHPDGDGTVEIDASIGDGGGLNETTFTVNVGAGGSAGGGSGGSDTTNPSGDEGALVWQSATLQPQGQNNPDVVSVAFENTDENNPIDITAVRYQFYDVDKQSSGQSVDPPRSFTITDNGGPTDPINYVGPYTSVEADLNSLASGDTSTYTFQFYQNENASGDFDPDPGDFFVISIRYELDGSVNTATYFIGISE